VEDRTQTPPATPPDTDPGRRGIAARIHLGRVFTPLPGEYLVIVSTVLVLTGFGLVMILSATSATATESGGNPYSAVLKQALFAAIGIPLMFIASRMPVGFWKRMAWPFLIFALLVQLLVYVPGLGVHAGGNQAWIQVGPFQAQPSEFVKMGMALWIAAVLARKGPLLSNWRHVYVPVVPGALLAMGTVLAGGDLGTTMVLVALLIGALFFSGVKLRIFVLPLVVFVAGCFVFAVTNSNRLARILSFLNPDTASCYYNECYQPLHGIWGLAGGGIFGLGLGNSKEKYDWLPAAPNDYIFAIVGEELGLVGCLLLLSLFVVLAVGIFRIIRRTDDLFVRVASGAIVTWITAQAFMNIAVVLRIFPVLGVPLPFVSQGGTSLVSVLFASGVLLSFTRSLPQPVVLTSPVVTTAAAPAPRGRRPVEDVAR
jgi:cell division protein FtsW